jgi:hypothetical protein
MHASSLKMEESVNYITEALRNKDSPMLANDQPSKETFFTEVEAIDITLKIVNLLEIVHEKELVYSNLCPEDIFLRDRDINKMCFTSLYHCIGEAVANLGIDAPDLSLNVS